MSSQHSLSQARFESPFDGIVTRRNVEDGENVLVGTMNNAGTVLLTVADMSVIEAEVEVDETDIPLVQFGQMAKITIDAIPDKTFTRQGHGDRQQSDSGDRRPDRRPADGDELQGDGDDRRSRFPKCVRASRAPPKSRRPRATQAAVGADPVVDRARDALRRARATSSGSRRGRRGRASSSVRPRRRRPRRRRSCSRARSARRSRASSSSATASAVVLPGQGRASPASATLEVAHGPEGRRPRDHRPVRVGARYVRRRSRAAATPPAPGRAQRQPPK